MSLHFTATAVKFIALLSIALVLNQTAYAKKSQKPGPPPWTAKAIKSGSIPEVYYAQWYKAKNQNTCALMVLSTANKMREAKPRRADFSGGWAVAYDTPKTRSIYGIAGTGSVALSFDHAKVFPNILRWSDGSYASYGLEGGTGPGYLAYVTVAGQGCAYNIWSKVSQEHLEGLLTGLRFAQRAGR